VVCILSHHHHLGRRREAYFTQRPSRLVVWRVVLDFGHFDNVSLIHAHPSRSQSRLISTHPRLMDPVTHSCTPTPLPTPHDFQFDSTQEIVTRNRFNTDSSKFDHYCIFSVDGGSWILVIYSFLASARVVHFSFCSPSYIVIACRLAIIVYSACFSGCVEDGVRSESLSKRSKAFLRSYLSLSKLNYSQC
jgi:hypothetical protein